MKARSPIHDPEHHLRRPRSSRPQAHRPRRRAEWPPRHELRAPPVRGTDNSGTIRVGRVFLDLGVRQGVYQKRPEGKAAAFEHFSYGQFKRDPGAYRDRVVGLIREAHRGGSKLVVLPACALQAYKSISLDDYSLSEVPLVVAGVRAARPIDESPTQHEQVRAHSGCRSRPVRQPLRLQHSSLRSKRCGRPCGPAKRSGVVVVDVVDTRHRGEVVPSTGANEGAAASP